MEQVDEHPRVFTVGHGNAPFQEIERLLRAHGIATLIDVRSTPFARSAPDFREGTLKDLCATVGLGHRWMGDRLGERKQDGGDAGTEDALTDVLALNAHGPVALLCTERDPEHCHRSTVLADALEARGVEVYHILPDGSAHRHQPRLGI